MKTTTKLFSGSLVERMLKTKDPLLKRIAACQKNRRTILYSRAYTIKKDGEFTFLPRGKAPEFNEKGQWTGKNRQSCKYGKALRDICAICKIKDVTDKDFEQAVYALQASVAVVEKKERKGDGTSSGAWRQFQEALQRDKPKPTPYLSDDVKLWAETIPVKVKIAEPEKYTFEVVQGEDIEKMYNQKEAKATSCFRGKPKEFFLFYEQNKNIKLLVLLKNGAMVARALLWHCVTGAIVMDRVYYDPQDQKTSSMMTQEARNRGYLIGWPHDYNLIVELDRTFTAAERPPYLDFQCHHHGDYISKLAVDTATLEKLRAAKVKI